MFIVVFVRSAKRSGLFISLDNLLFVMINKILINSMTKKIRYKMPETNSSSSHSLTIFKNDPTKPKCTLTLESDGSVMIPDYSEGDFGWGWDITTDPGVKACYTISCILGLYQGKTLKREKDRFEKIIKDYTGATRVKYQWYEEAQEENHYTSSAKKSALKNFAPTVDHQSIYDMYLNISVTDDSMRDFIFSNQSILLIGGEDCPPYDIMTDQFSDVNYEVNIILKTSGEPNIGYDVISSFQKWPGGEAVRERIDDLSRYFFYSEKNKSFEKWKTQKIEENDYCIPSVSYDEKTIKYYKSKTYQSITERILFGVSEDNIKNINDFKEIKFEIERKNLY